MVDKPTLPAGLVPYEPTPEERARFEQKVAAPALPEGFKPYTPTEEERKAFQLKAAGIDPKFVVDPKTGKAPFQTEAADPKQPAADEDRGFLDALFNPAAITSTAQLEASMAAQGSPVITAGRNAIKRSVETTKALGEIAAGEKLAQVARDTGKTVEQLKAEEAQNNGKPRGLLDLLTFDPIRAGMSNEQRDKIDDNVNAVTRRLTAGAADLTGLSDNAQENAKSLLSSAGDRMERMRVEAPKSQSAQRFEKAQFTTNPAGLMDAAALWGQNIKNDPAGFLAWSLETAGEQAVPLTASVVGGVVSRNPKVAATIAGATSGLQERYLTPLEYFKEKGYNLKDPQSVEKLIQDREVMEQASNDGVIRGTVIGALDALSVGTAGKVLSSGPVRNAILQAMKDAGLAVTGEVGAEVARGRDPNFNEALGEAAAEVPTTAFDILSASGEKSREASPGAGPGLEADAGKTSVGADGQQPGVPGADEVTPSPSAPGDFATPEATAILRRSGYTFDQILDMSKDEFEENLSDASRNGTKVNQAQIAAAEARLREAGRISEAAPVPAEIRRDPVPAVPPDDVPPTAPAATPVRNRIGMEDQAGVDFRTMQEMQRAADQQLSFLGDQGNPDLPPIRRPGDVAPTVPPEQRFLGRPAPQLPSVSNQPQPFDPAGVDFQTAREMQRAGMEQAAQPMPDPIIRPGDVAPAGPAGGLAAMLGRSAPPQQPAAGRTAPPSMYEGLTPQTLIDLRRTVEESLQRDIIERALPQPAPFPRTRRPADVPPNPSRTSIGQMVSGFTPDGRPGPGNMTIGQLVNRPFPAPVDRRPADVAPDTSNPLSIRDELELRKAATKGVQEDLRSRTAIQVPAPPAQKLLPAPSREGTRQAPIIVSKPSQLRPVTRVVNTSPTDAQKEAGNYQKGHIKVQGLDVTIETPKGAIRSGRDGRGREWSVKMPAHYGYVKRTRGADGEQVDVYVGENVASGKVFIVDQVDPRTGRFDEHKVILGALTKAEAARIYQSGFSDNSGRRRMGGMAVMDMAEFKAWVNGKADGPVSMEVEGQTAQTTQRPARAQKHRSVTPPKLSKDAPFTDVVDWLREQGDETGNEFLVAIDENGNIIDTITSDDDGRVVVSENIREATGNSGNKVVTVHNHPIDRPFSRSDLYFVGDAGTHAHVVVTNTGILHRMQLGKMMRNWRDSITSSGLGDTAKKNRMRKVSETLYYAIDSIHEATSDYRRQRMARGDASKIDEDQLDRDMQYARAFALAELGIIEYQTTDTITMDEIAARNPGLSEMIEARKAFVRRSIEREANGRAKLQSDRGTEFLHPGELGSPFEGAPRSRSAAAQSSPSDPVRGARSQDRAPDRASEAAEVDDGRGFRPTPKRERKLSIIDILYNPDYRPVKAGTYTVQQVAAQLAMRGIKSLEAMGVTDGTLYWKDITSDHKKMLSRVIASEVRANLESSSKSAANWYTTAIKEALELAAMLHPEIENNPDNRTAFLLALAITSQGETVVSNVRLTNLAFDVFKETGRFPTDLKAKKQKFVNGNFRAVNALLDTMSMAEVRAFMDTDFKAGDLKKMGYKNVAETNETIVKGSSILGSKIGGGFYQNLNGNYDPTTFDLWWMRGWGRITGTLVGQLNQKALDKTINRFTDALANERRNYLPQTVEEFYEEAVKIVKAHERRFIKEREAYNRGEWKKEELTKAAEALLKAMSGINESPTSGGMRNVMREVADGARKILNRSGYPELTNADLQAVWWYPEKALYARMGARDTERINTDYSGAFTKLLKKEGFTDEQITERLGRLERDAAVGGRSERADDGAGSEDGGDERGRVYEAERNVGGRGRGGGSGRDETAGRLAPLPGVPRVAEATGPVESLVGIAEDYARRAGINYQRQGEYVKADPDRGRRIADAYAQMEHEPTNPAVAEAYQELIRQTRAQYDALVEGGFSFYFYDPDGDDPYADMKGGFSNPWNAMRDLRKNKRMAVFPTFAGYGTGSQLDIGMEDPDGGPMLDPERVMQVVRENGGEIEAHAIYTSDSEPTVVMRLKKPISKAQGEKIADILNQQAIVQRTDDEKGELYGRMADAWGPYDPALFIVMGGKRASEVANPMLVETELKWPIGTPDSRKMVPVTANDLFRAVHDAFGHGLEGAGFRADGEENAWQAHVRLFYGSAVAAITSETRGQNSWLNFGPYGEANKTASVFDTIFADQKIGLMPEWTWTEGRAGDMPDDAKFSANPTSMMGARLSRIGINSKADLWQRWRDMMAGTASDSPNLSAAASGGRMARIDSMISAFKKDDAEGGMRAVLNRFGVAEDGTINAAIPRQILERAGIKPTLENAVRAFDELQGNRVGLTDDRIDALIREYGYTMDDRSKGWVAMIDPMDFLRATTSSDAQIAEIQREAGSLNRDRLKDERQTPFLYVDDGGRVAKITGHEGRHRMAALAAEGYDRVPVILRTANGESKAPIDVITLEAQQRGRPSISAKNLIPLNQKYVERIKAEVGQGDLRFSANDDSKVANLGVFREERQLKAFHKSLMEDIRDRVRQVSEAVAELRDAGLLPLNIGDRFTTQHTREKGQPPYRVIGYYYRPKTGSYGYYVQQGDEGSDYFVQTELPVFDEKTEARIGPEKWAQYQRDISRPMGGLRVVGDDGKFRAGSDYKPEGLTIDDIMERSPEVEDTADDDLENPQRSFAELDQAEARAIIERTTGKTMVEFWREIIVPGGIQSWGTQGRPTTAAGFMSAAKNLIVLALDSATNRTVYHEAWHAIEEWYANEAEATLLEREMPRLRAIVARMPENADRIDQMDAEEIRAEAASLYAVNRDVRGIHAGIRRLWNDILGMVRRTKNMMDGYGFRTSEDIFKAFHKGTMKDRGRRKNRATPLMFQPSKHGTAYEFDRFDEAFMGKGEGNQAFGWGFYSAQAKHRSKGIPQNYRRIAVRNRADRERNNMVTLDGKVPEDYTTEGQVVAKLAAVHRVNPRDLKGEMLSFVRSEEMGSIERSEKTIATQQARLDNMIAARPDDTDLIEYRQNEIAMYRAFINEARERIALLDELIANPDRLDVRKPFDTQPILTLGGVDIDNLDVSSRVKGDIFAAIDEDPEAQNRDEKFKGSISQTIVRHERVAARLRERLAEAEASTNPNPDELDRLRSLEEEHREAVVTLRRVLNGEFGSPGVQQPGFILTLDVPEDNEILVWDDPYNGQHPDVLDMLDSLEAALNGEGYLYDLMKDLGMIERDGVRAKVNADATEAGLQSLIKAFMDHKATTVERMYRQMVEMIGPLVGENSRFEYRKAPYIASKLLRKAGIKGHKFLDSNYRGSKSRDPDEVSFNFVTYAAEDIEVVGRKYAANPQKRIGRRQIGPQPQPPQMSIMQRLSVGTANRIKRMLYSNTKQDQADVNVGEGIFEFIRRKQIDYLDVAKRLIANEGTVEFGLDFYKAARMMEGTSRHELEDHTNTYVAPMIEEMNKAGISVEELSDYLYARHAEEANVIVGLRNEPGSPLHDAVTNTALPGASGKSTDWARQHLADLAKTPDKLAAMQAAEKHFRAMMDNNLRNMLRGGLITQNQYNDYANTFKNYVPLRAEEDDGFGGSVPNRSRGFDIRGKEVVGRTGRYTEADSPLIYGINQAEAMILRKEKNKVGNTILRFLNRFDPQGTKYAEVWSADLPLTLPPQQSIFNMVGNIQKAPVANKRVLGKDGKVKWEKDNDFALSEDIIATKVGGKVYYIRFNDKGVGYAMKKMTLAEADGVFKIFGAISFYQSAINTRFNPTFPIKNLLRDAQLAMVMMLRNDTTIMETLKIGAVFRTWPALIRWKRGKPDLNNPMDRTLQDFLKAGGRISFDQFDSIERRQARLMKEVALAGASKAHPKKVWHVIFNSIEMMNDVIENSTRLSVYDVMRKKGMQPGEAAYEARSLIDFQRKGESTPRANALFMFYNAAVQSSSAFGTALQSKKVWAVSGAFILAGFLQHFLNKALAGGDDEEENEYLKDLKAEPWKYERSYVIWGEDGATTVPLPFILNGFYYFGVQLAEMVDGTKEPLAALTDATRVGINSVNPLGSGSWLDMVSPTLLDPAIQIATNTDFAGRPIRNPDNPFSRVQDPQFTNPRGDVNPWAQDISEALNNLTGGDYAKPGAIDWSPNSIEYAFKWLVGGAGRFVADTYETAVRGTDGDIAPTKTPFLRDFYTERGEFSDRSLFYQVNDRVAEVEDNLKDYAKAKDPAKMQELKAEHRLEMELLSTFKGANKQLAAIRKARNAAKAEGDLDKVETFKETELEVMRKAMKRYYAVKRSIDNGNDR